MLLSSIGIFRSSNYSFGILLNFELVKELKSVKMSKNSFLRTINLPLFITLSRSWSMLIACLPRAFLSRVHHGTLIVVIKRVKEIAYRGSVPNL
jgi:hypothetical protein